MAYIIGLLDDKEEAKLTSRGWDVEVPSEELLHELDELPDRHKPGEPQFRMVWVDNDMFKIMSGPDWEKEKDDGVRK
jgi:hypothetical protein